MADLLIRRTRLVPITPGDQVPPTLVDVRIEEDTVVEIGSALPRPAGVEELDAEGRWLAPGLWDAHVHLGQWTAARQRFDLTTATSPTDVLDRLARHLATSPGGPIIGWGHRPGAWAHPGSVRDLDRVAGSTPVVLIAGDGHQGWLNSAALNALGLPPRRDDEQTVRENEWFAAYSLLHVLTGHPSTSPDAYRTTLDAAAALGVVGIVDFEFVGGIDDWIERWAAGCNQLKVRAAVYPEDLDSVEKRRLRTGDALADDERLTLGPLKIISDGSLNTRTAWCCEPYDGVGGHEHYGAPNLAADELLAHLTRARRSGLDVAVHAIGDAAVSRALDSFSATGVSGSIEHLQLTTREDVRRIASLGLTASVQPAHLLDDRGLIDKVWADRTHRCFAFRWMLEDGVPLAFGSDAPISPLDPWLAMGAAVRRSGDERDSWGPEQMLTTQEALAASVDGQAMVGLGSPGDLVLLDDDPLAVAPASGNSLERAPVAVTLVEGEIVHSLL